MRKEDVGVSTACFVMSLTGAGEAREVDDAPEPAHQDKDG
jgi:hypothetical protein